MKYKEAYSDEYKGVAFRLVRWGDVGGIGEPYTAREFNPIWNIYLIIDTKRIPAQYKPKSFLLRAKTYEGSSRKIREYWNHPVLSSIDFHGGITYYEPMNDGWIEVGCDYNHLHDHHSMYSFNYLFRDAEKAIDSFLSMVPGYKMWCCGNGKLYDKSEGVMRDNRFFSKEYFGDKHPEWFVPE